MYFVKLFYVEIIGKHVLSNLNNFWLRALNAHWLLLHESNANYSYSQITVIKQNTTFLTVDGRQIAKNCHKAEYK